MKYLKICFNFLFYLIITENIELLSHYFIKFDNRFVFIFESAVCACIAALTYNNFRKFTTQTSQNDRIMDIKCNISAVRVLTWWWLYRVVVRNLYQNGNCSQNKQLEKNLLNCYFNKTDIILAVFFLTNIKIYIQTII